MFRHIKEALLPGTAKKTFYGPHHRARIFFILCQTNTMIDRRKFIRLAGAGAAATAFASSTIRALAAPGAHAIGLQLYTLFPIMDQDPRGYLKKVAAIGYKEIESAYSKLPGFYGMKPKEFNATIRDLGMTWESHHVLGAPFHMPKGAKPMLDANGKPLTFPPMRNLTENMQELVDQAAEGGIPFL